MDKGWGWIACTQSVERSALNKVFLDAQRMGVVECKELEFYVI